MLNWFSKNNLYLDNLWKENSSNYIIEFINFNLWSKDKKKQILKNINLSIKKNSVFAIIGSSGSGKSSLIQCINKSIFNNSEYIYSGKILYKGIDICANDIPREILSIHVGIVFQKPQVFNMSIKDNLLLPLISHGIYDQDYLNRRIKKLLKDCSLWGELKERLQENPVNSLSGGQQQRLCIARSLAINPSVLLMDEPTSSLDPDSTSKIEDLIIDIKSNTTVMLVSHSLSQVRRVSEYTVLLIEGEIVECNETREIFTNPRNKLTRDYVSSKY